MHANKLLSAAFFQDDIILKYKQHRDCHFGCYGIAKYRTPIIPWFITIY